MKSEYASKSNKLIGSMKILYVNLKIIRNVNMLVLKSFLGIKNFTNFYKKIFSDKFSTPVIIWMLGREKSIPSLTIFDCINRMCPLMAQFCWMKH